MSSIEDADAPSESPPPSGPSRNGSSGEGTSAPGIQEALLRNPIRRRIVDQLGRTPGLNKNQLRNRLEILPNLLDFHLGRLQEAGIVVTQPSAQGKEVLCFLHADEELWKDEEARIMFGRRPTREVGLYVAEHPGAGSEEIAAGVGLEAVTVRHHLRTLREHDMIERIRLGRSFEYHPSQALQDWTERVGECFARPWVEGQTL